MTNAEANYRLKLSQGYLQEADQDASTARWRSCVDNSQLAAENAAKAVLALIGPVGRTHDPGTILLDALREKRFRLVLESEVRRLAASAERLGSEVHLESAYGDEATWRTPWELFDEQQARDALRAAEEAVSLATHIIQATEAASES